MAIWIALLTIGLPWIGALCVWGLGDERPSLQHKIASLFSILGALISIGLLFSASSEVVLKVPVGKVFGDFTLVLDGLGVYLSVIAAVIGCLAVVFSNSYMHGEAQLGRYYALVLMFIGAMVGLVLSGSLLLMFVFWEITAFCSYALISFHNDDPAAVAGGIKALIITQLGGIGLLIGALVSYANFNSYQISTFLREAHTLSPVALGLIAYGFLAAAAAKSAQAPFHTWLPDAMEAPTPVSALIHAATMVNAGVYLLARFYPAFETVPGWKTAVIGVGLFTALLAAIMALCTHDLKRVLAYSTISQLGYMFYAIGCGAILASQYHLLNHSVFKALLFLGAGAIIHSVGTRDMRQMGGLKQSMPFTRTVFLIGLLGLAGIPIANGFFSKELILEEGLTAGPLWAYVGILLVAGGTAMYSIRMLVSVFYGKSNVDKLVHDASWVMRICLALLALGTVTTWLLYGPFTNLLEASLPFHHIETGSTTRLASHILSAPATWLAIGIVLLGIVLWLVRNRLAWLEKIIKPIVIAARHGFGFEWLNLQVISLVRKAASVLGNTQTGELNWNVLGIVLGFAAVLGLLVWGA